MLRDMGSICKKRQHPDGLQLSSPLPKRLLSISEAEICSSIDTASSSPGTGINTPHGSLWNSASMDTASISPGTAMNTLHGSFCNSASSALINSDCSTSIRPTHSSISLNVASFTLDGPGFMHSLIPSDVASSKLEGPGFLLSCIPAEGPGFVHSLKPSDVASSKLEGPAFVLSRIPAAAASSKLEGAGSVHSLRPCNTASYSPGVLNSSKESKGKGIWTYHSDSTKGLDYEGELSEVTSEKHARTHGPDGVSRSEKATHIISRRDVSSLNSKDELWHKAAYGHGDYVSRGKQWESSSMLYSARQRRDNAIFSMASESASSCATADSLMEEIRPKQAFPHIYRSVRKESPSHTHTRAEVLVGEIIGSKDEAVTEERSPSYVLSPVLHSSTQKAATEELSPSYVLSSGRMSLEEEARLGRRAPTIDHDFEEYFSSLML